MNNIAFGNTKATREDVIKAAKKARCHEFIMKLENSYDTVKLNGQYKRQYDFYRRTKIADEI